MGDHGGVQAAGTRDVHFRDALPKGGTGKVLKAELREPFWKGHDARVQ